MSDVGFGELLSVSSAMTDDFRLDQLRQLRDERLAHLEELETSNLLTGDEFDHQTKCLAVQCEVEQLKEQIARLEARDV